MVGPSKSKRARTGPSAAASSFTTSDKLRWKKVKRPSQASFGQFDHEGGILDLEEVEGVEVVYEELPGGGKRVSFKQVAKDPAEEDELEEDEELFASGSMLDEEEALERAAGGGDMMEDDEQEDKEEYETWNGIEADVVEQPQAGPSKIAAAPAPAPISAPAAAPIVAPEPVIETFDDSLLPHWASLQLHPLLKKAVFGLGFFKPSPIQSASLPLGLSGRDVVGVAETGSGKTLSYGLPLLSHCLSLPPPLPSTAQKQVKRQMQALILAPTRELALQVAQHLQKVMDAALAPPKATDEEEAAASEALAEGSDKKKKQVPKGAPRVSIGAIVGGMSAQKQRRVLERGVDVLVATPGRLWDLIGENDSIAQSIRQIKFLVIDEADRMIETGHFLELESIVALTRRAASDSAPAAPAPGSSVAEDLAFVQDDDEAKTAEAMQTFVFSATLSKDLQRNLKKFAGKPREGKRKKGTTLEDLVEKLDFRDDNPEVIDLSPVDGVVSTLQESKIECLANEKDLYLYYFLLRYPGRSLIFFGSIDGIRRAIPLLELLKFPIFPLHSQLQQKQRLKNLDRFKSTPNGILLATDIAARGLDIPSVDHVIHYQLPRSADSYVHRSGRTARAKMVGFSLQLCSPEEKKVQRALMKSLGREDDLPELPIEHGMLDRLKARILVARQIDSANHKVKKDNHERSWMKEAADALEIELDSDLSAGEDEDHQGGRPSRSLAKKTNAGKVGALKAELRSLLAESLVARGISKKYLTSGSRKIVDALLQGAEHPTMMGMETTTAAADAAVGRSKKRKAATLTAA